MKARSGPRRPTAQSLTAETFLRSASSTLAFLAGGASASTAVPVCMRDSGWATNDRQ